MISQIQDTIFYGYAFNNQWMWYNGVPNTLSGTKHITLIVWKDYNCQDWKYSGFGASVTTSNFTTEQKALIGAEIAKMTSAGIQNDVWGTAFTMMKNLQDDAS